MRTDRATRARASAAEHALDAEKSRLARSVELYPQAVGPIVVEDYVRESGTRHALERKLQALGQGPPEDPADHIARGGSEHLQPPGTVDETGFCEGGIV